MSTPPSFDPLLKLRDELDSIDSQIIEALGRRFEICKRIGLAKAHASIPTLQPKRVEFVRARAMAGARAHGFSEAAGLAIYELIIKEACRIEDEVIGGETSHT